MGRGLNWRRRTPAKLAAFLRADLRRAPLESFGSPKSPAWLQSGWSPGQRAARRHVLAYEAFDWIRRWASAKNSPGAREPRSPSRRWRTATSPESASRWPTTSM